MVKLEKKIHVNDECEHNICGLKCSRGLGPGFSKQMTFDGGMGTATSLRGFESTTLHL